VVATLAESSRNSWITGHLKRARADSEAAVALGRELRHPDSLAFAWLFHGWMRGYRGDWTTCIASAENGIGIARESGSVQVLTWNRCVHGWAAAHLGEFQRGRSELREAMDASKAIMGEVALPQFITMMAEVLLVGGQPASAEAWLTQAVEFDTAHDDRYFAAEVRRLLSVCAAARGDTDGARAYLYKALEISRSQGATLFELRAALTLAEHDLREARATVRSALAKFPEPEPCSEVNAAQRILC